MIQKNIIGIENKNDILKFLLYENRKTFLLNNAYLNLIPLKVKKLKSIKNHLLKISYFYKSYIQNNKNLFVTLENKKNILNSSYDLLSSYNNTLLVIDDLSYNNDTEKQNDLKIIYSLIDDINNDIKTFISEIENIKSNDIYLSLNRFSNHIINLKFLILTIEKNIKAYNNDLNKKVLKFNFKIGLNDITEFLKGHINDNVKNVLNAYLVFRLKHNISNEKMLLLENNNFYNYSYIDDIIKFREIKKFRNDFLNKTL